MAPSRPRSIIGDTEDSHEGRPTLGTLQCPERSSDLNGSALAADE